MHSKKLIAPRDGCVIIEETIMQFQEFELLSRAAITLRMKILFMSKKSLRNPLLFSDFIAGHAKLQKIFRILCAIYYVAFIGGR